MFNHPMFKIDNATDDMVAQVKALTQSDEEDIISLPDFRKEYRKETGKKLELSDDEIIFLIAGVNDDIPMSDYVDIINTRVTGEESEDDADDERDREQEQIIIDRNTADQLTKAAKAFAKKLDDDTVKEMFDIQMADETSKRGIAIMLYPKIYGPKAWDAETWALIPDPRLDKDDVKAMQGRSNVPLPRWTYKEGARNRVGDWFETAIVNTTLGAALVKQKADVEASGLDGPKTADQQKYVSLMPSQRERLVNQLDARIKNIVRRWKRMVALKLTIDEINQHPLNKDNVVHAELYHKYDKDNKEIGLADELECVGIERVVNKKVVSYWNAQPSTFMRLSPQDVDEKLVKEKGFYEALLSTKDREPTPGGSDFKVPTSPEKFIGAMNSMAHYFEEGTNLEAFIGYYAKQDAQQQLEIGDTVREAAQKIGAFYTAVKPTLERLETAQKEQVKAAVQPKQLAKAS